MRAALWRVGAARLLNQHERCATAKRASSIPHAAQPHCACEDLAHRVSSIHYLLVVLTCGIYGRQADGTYFGAKAYTELRDAGPEPDHMYSA